MLVFLVAMFTLIFVFVAMWVVLYFNFFAVSKLKLVHHTTHAATTTPNTTTTNTRYQPLRPPSK